MTVSKPRSLGKPIDANGAAALNADAFAFDWQLPEDSSATLFGLSNAFEHLLDTPAAPPAATLAGLQQAALALNADAFAFDGWQLPEDSSATLFGLSTPSNTCWIRQQRLRPQRH